MCEDTPFITPGSVGSTLLISTANNPVQMPGPETPDSPQVKLLRVVAEALDTQNLDLLADALHKDLRRTIYPRSIGRPECNKEEWLQGATKFFGCLPDGAEASDIC